MKFAGNCHSLHKMIPLGPLYEYFGNFAQLHHLMRNQSNEEEEQQQLTYV